MPTIYRKYRPQKWEEVVGQNHVKLTLQREIETGNLSHAYLFSGPRGIGKTTLARLLAKAVNCLDRAEGTSEPCDQCAPCRETIEGHSLDVLEIDAASHTGVDNVRENIIDSAQFRPSRNKYKVFIIDEAHMLSPGAFNALLKSLEEPPPYVIFVLATTEKHKLPQTIVSRCQGFDFKKVNIEDIVKRLKMIAEEEKIKIEKKILERIAYRSEGCLRDAEGLLGQIFSLDLKEITEKEAGLILPRSSFNEASELLKLVVGNDIKAGLSFVNNLVEEGVDLGRFMEDLIAYTRFVMLSKLGGDLSRLGFELDEGNLQTANKLAKEISQGKLVKIIETLLKQKTFLASSPLPQLPLEMALVSFCENASSPPLEKINSSATIKKIVRQETPQPGTNLKPVPAVDLPPVSVDPGVAVSLDFIREKWQDFLKRVQDYNHSLSFILRMSEPLRIEKDVVQIGVKYNFHRDKLNEPKLRALAQKALVDVLGREMGLEAVLCAPETNSGAVVEGNEAIVESLAQAFGGRVVEGPGGG